MRKFISVNAKYYKASQITKINNHNTRTSNIDYLLKDNDCNYKNLNYSINPRNTLVENFTEQFDNKCKDQIANKFFKPKTGNENEIIDMVVALSQEQAINYLNKPNGEQLLLDGYKEFLSQIEKEDLMQNLGA